MDVHLIGIGSSVSRIKFLLGHNVLIPKFEMVVPWVARTYLPQNVHTA